LIDEVLAFQLPVVREELYGALVPAPGLPNLLKQRGGGNHSQSGGIAGGYRLTVQYSTYRAAPGGLVSVPHGSPAVLQFMETAARNKLPNNCHFVM
jgi:hypothetical protein